MRKVAQYTLMVLSLSLITMSCSTTRKVKRVEVGKEMDLSGRWNDTDSKQTADAIIEDVIADAWISEHQASNDSQKPKVIVGIIRNKSHEHIDSESFVRDVEKSFVKSRRVKLIQGGKKREELRGERTEQNKGNTSPETVKKWGKELGADYMLQGTINSIVDSYKNKRVIYYQINLQLTNLETNEVVWIGDKKIKKFVKN